MESPLTWAAIGGAVLFLITVGTFANTFIQQGKKERQEIFKAITTAENNRIQTGKELHNRIEILQRDQVKIITDNKNDIITIYRDLFNKETQKND